MNANDGLLPLLQQLFQGAPGSNQLAAGAMDSLLAALDATAAWVYVVDADGVLRLVGTHGLDPDLLVRITSLSGASAAAAAQAVREGTCIDADKDRARAENDRAILERTHADQLHAIPLGIRGREPTGVLVFSTTDTCAPAPARVEAIASALALALAEMNARQTASSAERLVDSTMRMVHELINHLPRLPMALTLAELRSNYQGPEFNLKQFFSLVAEQAQSLVDAEMAAVGVVTSPGGAFDPWIAVGVSEEEENAIGRPPRPVGTLGTVAFAGETIRVKEIHQHPAFVGLPSAHPAIKSLLAVPIRFRDESLGNIYVANKRGAPEFAARDQQIIQLLAAFAGSGIRLSATLAMIEGDRRTLRHILDGAPDGILFLDANTGHVLSNQAFEALLGRPVERMRGLLQELGLVCWPDGRPLTVDELPSARALRGETTVEQELLFVQPGQRRIPVREHSAPIRGADGRILGAVVVARDITEPKKLLDDIAQERTLFRTLLEASPDGILFVDSAAQQIITNHAFERLLGKPIRAQVDLHQSLGSIRDPCGRALALAELPVSRALAGETITACELIYEHPDGHRVPVAENAAPLRRSDGSLFGAIVTCRNISAQKQIERLREEFAAMVAHDLRNPIHALLLQIQNIRKLTNTGAPAPHASLDRISQISLRLVRMAGDLLDATRIDLAHLTLDRQPVELGELVHGLVDRIRPTLGDHEVVIHSGAPIASIALDATRVEQVMSNLLENASKHSDATRPIEVCLTAVADGVEITVCDHGIGVSPEELAHLFDRFYQVKRARQRKTGLGLGLYIAKGFVEAHGGRIWVESALGRGSTFHLWFPRMDAG